MELRVESRVELRVQLQSEGSSEGRIKGGIEGGIVLLFCVSPLPPPPGMGRKKTGSPGVPSDVSAGGGGNKSSFKFECQLGLGPGLFSLKKHVA